MASCWNCGGNPTDCNCDGSLGREAEELRAEVAALRQQLDEARGLVALCEKHSLRDEADMLRIFERAQRVVVDRDRLLDVYRALEALVKLKDGPRDEEYKRAKPAAWEHARAALDAYRAGAPAETPGR